jgi:hypothetical protein
MIQCTWAFLKNSTSVRQSRVRTYVHRSYVCTEPPPSLSCTHTHSYIFICMHIYQKPNLRHVWETSCSIQATDKNCNGGFGKIKQELPTVVTKNYIHSIFQLNFLQSMLYLCLLLFYVS